MVRRTALACTFLLLVSGAPLVAQQDLDGKLVEIGPNAVRLEVNGAVTTIGVTRDTVVRVYAKAGREVLTPGMTVAVHGVVGADQVIKTDRGSLSFDGEVLAYLFEKPPEASRTPSNVVPLRDGKQVQMIAKVVSADPFIVEGFHEYTTPGLTIPHPTKAGLLLLSVRGKRFKVEPGKEEFLVLHLGKRADLAGPGARAIVFKSAQNPAVAKLLILERAEPVTAEDLGIKKPKAAGGKVKKKEGK